MVWWSIFGNVIKATDENGKFRVATVTVQDSADEPVTSEIWVDVGVCFIQFLIRCMRKFIVININCRTIDRYRRDF